MYEPKYINQEPGLDRKLLGDAAPLKEVVVKLEALPADRFDPAQVRAAIWTYAEATGKQKVLWPMRVALTGRRQSLDPFLVTAALGKTKTLKRLYDAIN